MLHQCVRSVEFWCAPRGNSIRKCETGKRTTAAVLMQNKILIFQASQKLKKNTVFTAFLKMHTVFAKKIFAKTL